MAAKKTDDKIDFEKISLEEGFSMIEDLMNDMSESDIPLEESFEKYKQGMEILKACSDKIDKVEKEIKLLTAEDVS